MPAHLGKLVADFDEVGAGLRGLAAWPLLWIAADCRATIGAADLELSIEVLTNE